MQGFLSSITATRWTVVMIIGHIAALIFGLLGLLVAVPNPHLWADSEMGVRVYSWGMQYAGGSHIIFATIAMLLIGFRFLGTRRTLIFFAITCVISLGAELLGTTTGFPFGDYRYTSGLGYQILGEVPFTIPLSWFYMGLASYILALVLVGTGGSWRRTFASVLTGSIILTIWDLVLDPAMAHQELGVRFWIWEQGGIYFDMPAQNFLGWVLTGFVFIGLSRIVWGSDPVLSTGLVRVSFVIYLANLIFAMVISAAVGLWWPVLITIIIGVVPSVLALLTAEGWPNGRKSPGPGESADTVQRVARGVMTIGARLFLWQGATKVRSDGLSNIPKSGPALLVTRHFHHLYDGCVLQTRLPRQSHTLVAIDWVSSNMQRRLLERACQMARWPIVVRPGSPGEARFDPKERIGILRTAFRESVDLLTAGNLVNIFPEGYPVIDPHSETRSPDDDFLPFDPGFIAIVRAAERRSGLRVPIIPVGLSYEPDSGNRWSIDMRIGAPVYHDTYQDEESLIEDLSARVRALSAPAGSLVFAESKPLTEQT
jgi:carotene biosynthesis associated membrane protein